MMPNTEYGARPPAEFIYTLLSEDHQRLDRLFAAVVVGTRGGDPTAMTAIWNQFEREFGSHLDLEEKEILPSFARVHPDEARALRDEHAGIRAAITELGVDLDLHCLRAERVDAFIELVRSHARREESLLYRWATRELGHRREP